MSDLSNILKKQYAAQQEQALAELKSAYEKNTSSLDEQAAAIPQQYEASRNDVAAQNAIARKNFNEQAAATGMNTGTAGQAELARSSAYQSALAGLHASQQNAQQALDRDRKSLQAQYENAIAAAKAENAAALNNALYQALLQQSAYSGTPTQSAYSGTSSAAEEDEDNSAAAWGPGVSAEDKVVGGLRVNEWKMTLRNLGALISSGNDTGAHRYMDAVTRDGLINQEQYNVLRKMMADAGLI